MRSRLAQCLYKISTSPAISLFLYVLGILVFAVAYCRWWRDFEAISSGWDGLYFSVVTATTLGFGDIKPISGAGQLLVSVQVLLEVLFVGLFLNSLAFKVSERVKREEEKQIVAEKERLRAGLDRHLSLLVEAVRDGNPFHWDKHAEHAGGLSEREIDQILGWLKDSSPKLHALRIKSLLETSDQIYELMLGLLSVAGDISPLHLLKFSSILSNVRNLRDQYRAAIEGAYGQKDNEDHVAPTWPDLDDVVLQIHELLSGCAFFSQKITSMTDLDNAWLLHEMKTI